MSFQEKLKTMPEAERRVVLRMLAEITDPARLERAREQIRRGEYEVLIPKR